MTMRGSAGGAAAAMGIDFQARVAAWVAVQILGEQNAAPPWMLPAGTTLKWLRCETEEPVDDLLVATSGDGFAFVQVKHTVDLSATPRSELASVFDQFVRQFLSSRTTRPRSKKWQRPLELMRDRLVLVVGSTAPSTIRLHLPSVLQKVRELVPGQSLDDVARNEEERRALSVITEHIRNSWHSTLSATPTEHDIRQILSLAYVQVLAIEGGNDEQNAKNLLRSGVLTDPTQADAAWACLISFCIGLAQKRSWADRLGLQGELIKLGIGLQSTRSYQMDVKRLQDCSSRIRSLLSDLAHIRVSEKQIKIVRRFNQELMRAAEDGSLLIVGDPGSGKSGALYDLVEALSDTSDTLFLAVDRLLAEGSGGLRHDLNLEDDLLL
jgi:hypothetical protein